jgi:polyisoprenoid-binding protein YceI
MRKNLMAMALAMCAVTGLGMVAAGDDYAIDPVHSGVTFQILHANVSYIPGRFNQFSGECTLDTTDPAKSSFKMSIKADSVDTNNAKRDGHLKSPDFFNAKQYPTIEFASTSVAAIDGGYKVTGNLTFHGETKPVTFDLKGGNKAEFPKGFERTGFTTSFQIKRSDFGVGKKFGGNMLGDDVFVTIGFEATKKP